MAEGLSESRKISIIISMILLGMFAVGGVAYLTISDVRRQLSHIADNDIPLTQTAGEITITQLEQTIAFGQCLRLGEMMATDRGQAAAFAEARRNFERVGRSVVDNLDRASRLARSVLVSATTPGRRDTYERLLDRFEEIRIQHNLYEGEARAILKLLADGQVAQAMSLVPEIEQREGEIGRAVKTTLREIGTFVEAASIAAARQERNALAIIGLLVTVTSTIGIVTGFLTVRAIRADRLLRTEREQDLFARASYDPLTRLPNRDHFMSLADKALRGAHRYKTSMAVMFVDLDGFKQVNDTLGHQIGDELLQEVAERLSRSIRETDSVGRLGGDEFIVYVTDAKSREDVATVARKLIDYLSVPFRLQAEEVKIGASVGIAMYPGDGTDIESLLAQADVAMYEAKKAGKNAYRFSDAGPLSA